MTKKKQNEQHPNTTSFHGPVYGPVHTGNGSIHIEQLRYDTGTNSLSDLRTEVVTRFDATSYHTVNAIIERLSIERVQELGEVIKALEAQHLSQQEMMDLLTEIGQAILEAREHEILPGTGRDIVELTQAIDGPNLEAAHKLKLSIPIIPYLLDYETELGLNSKIDLEKAWNWLRSRLQRS
jgi:hypothetical protein